MEEKTTPCIFGESKRNELTLLTFLDGVMLIFICYQVMIFTFDNCWVFKNLIDWFGAMCLLLSTVRMCPRFFIGWMEFALFWQAVWDVYRCQHEWGKALLPTTSHADSQTYYTYAVRGMYIWQRQPFNIRQEIIWEHPYECVYSVWWSSSSG